MIEKKNSLQKKKNPKPQTKKTQQTVGMNWFSCHSSSYKTSQAYTEGEC